MQNIISKTVLIAISASVLVSCKPDLKAPSPSSGSIDATKYVAIGNSITSGYADGALYYQGQAVSYANLLAEQLKLVGGGDFKTPYMPESSVGIGSSGNAPFVLGYSTDCKGVSSLAPVPAATSGDFSLFNPSNTIGAQGPFNNMGVPGAKCITTIFPSYGNPSNGFGNYNPYFTRMLTPSEFASKSILDKASSQNHTFFTTFIGNNDVLGYATSGGTSDAITPSAGGPGVGFDVSYDVIINTMTANGAKGAIASIPDVTSLPYFTTIPYNGLALDATSAAQLSAAYAPLGISFAEGNNAFIIADAAAPGGMRKIKSNEFVLLTLPLDSVKCKGWGSMKPIASKYILDETEASNVRTAVNAYNSKIQAVASAKGLAYVDVNAFMATAKTGITYNGIAINASFVSGGAFSLDGVHLSPRGNALLANEFIKAINSTYGSTIPHVNVAKYAGVKFP